MARLARANFNRLLTMPKKDPKEFLANPQARRASRFSVFLNGLRRFNVAPSVLHPRGVFTGGVSVSFFDTTTGVLYAADNTPVTTETYVHELLVPYPCRITGLAIANGSAVAGNVTVGLADNDGNPIPGIVSAATAQSGTNAYQKIAFGTPLDCEGPARYFAMVQFSSASARYRGHKAGIGFCAAQTSQTFGTLKAFTPPTGFAAAGAIIAQAY